MIRDLMGTMTDAQAFPIFSMLLFLAFFLLLIFWVVKLDKGFVNKMKCLPLEEQSEKNKVSEGYDG